jgi:outer membrane protein TolC
MITFSHISTKSIVNLSIILILLSGCTRYEAKPLPENVSLSDSVDKLKGAPQITSPLNIQQVALLALLNNSDLTAKRAQLQVSKAQIISAQLFPDPLQSMNIDQPVNGSSGLVNAWGIGLSYDLMSLLTHTDQVTSAQEAFKSSKMTLQWQEWQVVQQARTLFVRSVLEHKRLHLLSTSLQLYQSRYALSQSELQKGNVTLDVTSIDLTSLLDLTTQINQLAQTHNDTQQALANIMSLNSRTTFQLQDLPTLTPLSVDELETYQKKLNTTRPDLLALKAGYLSQEANVRNAIMAQFPAITLGVSRASDTGGVLTNGLNLSLNLPLLNGNRGVIAQTRATRAQLFAEFQARLNQAHNEVQKLGQRERLLNQQQVQLNQLLPEVHKLLIQARPAYQAGELNALIFINLETSWIQKQLDQLNIEQLRWENKIALQTLLAIPMESPVKLTKPTLMGDKL